MPNNVITWNVFYKTIKADAWPDCDNETDFHLLPEVIKSEIISDFEYFDGKFLVTEQLKTNTAFCILPFIHLYINESNNLHTCCHGSPIKEHDSSFDFYNDTNFELIRTRMKDGIQDDHCGACYQLEDNGGESVRIRNTIEWANKLQLRDINTVETKLRYYDIRNDNLCNLACRTCRPEASSQLEKEYKKLNWKTRGNINKSTLTQIIDYDTVEEVYIAGGEPMIMPEFTKFLVTAIAQNRTDIRLIIITNITKVNHNILSLLSQFDTVSVTISLDGYDSVNEYIRWPFNWSIVEKNIKLLTKLTSNISVNVTVSIYNITRLHELVTFLETVLPVPATILLNTASDGVYCPFIYPNKNLVIQRLELLKQTHSYIHEYYFANKVDYLINMVMKTEVDLIKLSKFFDYNDALDASRNINLIDYIPELEECRKYITKQI